MLRIRTQNRQVWCFMKDISLKRCTQDVCWYLRAGLAGECQAQSLPSKSTGPQCPRIRTGEVWALLGVRVKERGLYFAWGKAIHCFSQRPCLKLSLGTLDSINYQFRDLGDSNLLCASFSLTNHSLASRFLASLTYQKKKKISLWGYIKTSPMPHASLKWGIKATHILPSKINVAIHVT